MMFHRASRSTGITIAEVLLALGFFAIAMVGLFTAMNAINQGIATSMRRNVEAAYANMLISRVNPYAQDVETAFNKTSTSCAGSRCSIDIPNSYNPGNGTPASEKVYYTILVNSNWNAALHSPATADVKLINLHFYRNATTTTPYRQFRREIAPDIMGWTMGGASAYYRDATGLLWTKISDTKMFSSTAGSIAAGIDSASTPSGTPLSTVSTATNPTNIPSVDAVLWRYAMEPKGTGTSFGFSFPATSARRYIVELGFNEFDSTVTAAGQRIFDIYINNVLVDSAVDIYSLTGGKNKAIIKSYTVVPAIPASNVPTITVKLQQNGGTKKPRVSWIRIRRT
jgi:hypothetical protein